DLGANLLRGDADLGGALGLAGGIAVGEVEADHVDAGAEQRLQHARRVGCRSEGGKDLGAAQAIGHVGEGSLKTGEINTKDQCNGSAVSERNCPPDKDFLPISYIRVRMGAASLVPLP